MSVLFSQRLCTVFVEVRTTILECAPAKNADEHLQRLGGNLCSTMIKPLPRAREHRVSKRWEEDFCIRLRLQADRRGKMVKRGQLRESSMKRMLWIVNVRTVKDSHSIGRSPARDEPEKGKTEGITHDEREYKPQPAAVSRRIHST